jgi:hypothetical protein
MFTTSWLRSLAKITRIFSLQFLFSCFYFPHVSRETHGEASLERNDNGKFLFVWYKVHKEKAVCNISKTANRSTATQRIARKLTLLSVSVCWFMSQRWSPILQMRIFGLEKCSTPSTALSFCIFFCAALFHLFFHAILFLPFLFVLLQYLSCIFPVSASAVRYC